MHEDKPDKTPISPEEQRRPLSPERLRLLKEFRKTLVEKAKTQPTPETKDDK